MDKRLVDLREFYLDFLMAVSKVALSVVVLAYATGMWMVGNSVSLLVDMKVDLKGYKWEHWMVEMMVNSKVEMMVALSATMKENDSAVQTAEWMAIEKAG